MLRHSNEAMKQPGESKLSQNAMGNRPGYDLHRPMQEHRATRAQGLAEQALSACKPFLLSEQTSALALIDVGCGYGHTLLEYAKHFNAVVGLEPSFPLFQEADRLTQDVHNITVRNSRAELMNENSTYDVVVMDNVLEHIEHQATSLENIVRSLCPGGIAYIVVPNKWWPIEVHYGLPFLSYLPLSLANWYLRLSGRGHDYRDASYAPSYFSLRRMLRRISCISFHFVVPEDVSTARLGQKLHYRFGVWLLRRFPFLWPVSKIFVVVIKKEASCNKPTPK
ncbi:class I SAM-dependent methyltransferase [Gimesia aquarii]|uniref:Uncharacterized protein n=1 Tax=Gimesia aquarii TaxID=2527964 RepID=A0A517VZZ6_9PLAN|nr:class I SAM-dependent methyltransferase [Gimesia aquarii]QDT98567.1 hypothetical protein V144x_40740 [Gimesia aquarii]